MNDNCDFDRVDLALDADATDAEREWVSLHLQSCLSCRAYVARARMLEARLASLPADIEPARPLWPGIAERLSGSTHTGPEQVAPRSLLPQRVLPSRSAPASRAWRLSAAVALFALGFAAGTLGRVPEDTPPISHLASRTGAESVTADAAEDVQRLGSAWTAALARLGGAAPSTGEPTRRQREVALATMRGAVSELTRIIPDRPGVAAAYTAISEEHRKAGSPDSVPRRVAF